MKLSQNLKIVNRQKPPALGTTAGPPEYLYSPLDLDRASFTSSLPGSRASLLILSSLAMDDVTTVQQHASASASRAGAFFRGVLPETHRPLLREKENAAPEGIPAYCWLLVMCDWNPRQCLDRRAFSAPPDDDPRKASQDLKLLGWPWNSCWASGHQLNASDQIPFPPPSVGAGFARP